MTKLRSSCEKKREKANGRKYANNNYQKTAYPLVMGKLSPALWAQLEGSKGYEKINDAQVMVDLLKLIGVYAANMT